MIATRTRLLAYTAIAAGNITSVIGGVLLATAAPAWPGAALIALGTAVGTTAWVILADARRGAGRRERSQPESFRYQLIRALARATPAFRPVTCPAADGANRAADTYWVDGAQVTKTDYVKAERDAGFRNTLGRPGEPATSYWSGIGSDGLRHSGRLGYMRRTAATKETSP